MRKSKVVKYLCISIGLISVGLGMIGVFIPLLPTTPFLLLASYCFIRSSTRLHEWLMNHRVFGKYLQNYINNRAVSKSVKIVSISVLWITIIISFLLIDNLYARITLVFVLIGVTIHLSILKVIE